MEEKTHFSWSQTIALALTITVGVWGLNVLTWNIFKDAFQPQLVQLQQAQEAMRAEILRLTEENVRLQYGKRDKR